MLQRGLASSPLVASNFRHTVAKSVTLQRYAEAHVFSEAYLVCSLAFGHKKGN